MDSHILTPNRFFDKKMLIALVLPLVLEQAVNLTVGLADSLMVSSVGEAAVSGVSLIDNIYILIINIFSALSTGGAVIAGQYLGRQEREDASRASSELIRLVFAISVVFMVLLYACKLFILNVVFGKIEPDVYANAETYLLIVNLSVPFMGLYNACAAVFRTMGNSKICLKISVVMGLVNLLGNAIGVYVLHAGIAGVAVPTLISRAFGGIYMYLRLRRTQGEIEIDDRLVKKFDGALVRRILHIGVPNGLENGMFQLGKIMILSIVAVFGTSAITANAVGTTLANIQVIPGLAISLAITPVISRCIGAADYEQAKYYNKKLLLISYAAIIGTALVLLALTPVLLRLYNLSAETSEQTMKIVIYHTIALSVIWPIAFNLPATFRAAGDVTFTMIISIISMWIFRLGVGYILAIPLNMGVIGVWFAMFADWIFRAAIFTGRYFSHRWELFKTI